MLERFEGRDRRDVVVAKVAPRRTERGSEMPVAGTITQQVFTRRLRGNYEIGRMLATRFHGT